MRICHQQTSLVALRRDRHNQLIHLVHSSPGRRVRPLRPRPRPRTTRLLPEMSSFWQSDPSRPAPAPGAGLATRASDHDGRVDPRGSPGAGDGPSALTASSRACGISPYSTLGRNHSPRTRRTYAGTKGTGPAELRSHPDEHTRRRRGWFLAPIGESTEARVTSKYTPMGAGCVRPVPPFLHPRSPQTLDPPHALRQISAGSDQIPTFLRGH